MPRASSALVSLARSPPRRSPASRHDHRDRATHACPSRRDRRPQSRQRPIDGRLDDEGWSKATPITEFTQIDPEGGQAGTQRTEVRFLYDNEALYVGARMYEKNGPKDIVTRLVRRDGDMESDYFEVVIDAYHDHLGRAFFDVNPSG
jgi:hypothetical protein